MKAVKQLLLLSLAILFCTNLNAQWNQLGLDIDGEAIGDRSGHTVSVSADGLTVAIGGYLK